MKEGDKTTINIPNEVIDADFSEWALVGGDEKAEREYVPKEETTTDVKALKAEKQIQIFQMRHAMRKIGDRANMLANVKAA